MAKQTISRGTTAYDGTGDGFRTAMGKANDNFDELYRHSRVGAAIALTDGATIATDASLGHTFKVTLGGNRTLSNPTNGIDGQRLTWRIRQDATGSRTITLDTKFRLGTTISSVTLTTTAAKTDYLEAVYHSSDDKWDVVAFTKGF